MSLNIRMLISLRERKKKLAEQALVRERQAFEAACAALSHEQTALRAQLEAKSILWQSVQAREASAFKVCDLRETKAWSRALDAQIVAARTKVDEAQQRAQQQHTNAQASRRRWAASVAGLQNAERIDARYAEQAKRLRESRLADRVEESTSHAWQASVPRGPL